MPQDPLNIEDLGESPSGQRVLRLTGPIVISNFFQFQTMLRADASRVLILDLTSVPYVDSAGIGALVGAYVTRQKNGRSLVLAGAPARIRTTMQVTHVEQFFKFYDTVEAAQAGSSAA